MRNPLLETSRSSTPANPLRDAGLANGLAGAEVNIAGEI
jgi:hypothetical protein